MARSVLVVEDDRMVRGILGEALSTCGYRVVAVADGRRALTRLYEETEPPDAVVLDWSLPDMSGDELVAALAMHPQQAAIPLVVLSTCDRPLQLRHQAPAVVLLKPVRVRTLVQVLDRLCGVPLRAIPFKTGAYPVAHGAPPGK